MYKRSLAEALPQYALQSCAVAYHAGEPVRGTPLPLAARVGKHCEFAATTLFASGAQDVLLQTHSGVLIWAPCNN